MPAEPRKLLVSRSKLSTFVTAGVTRKASCSARYLSISIPLALVLSLWSLARSLPITEFTRATGSYEKYWKSWKSETCMRAVNRQPMFTARGTRRAFSLYYFSLAMTSHIVARCYSLFSAYIWAVITNRKSMEIMKNQKKWQNFFIFVILFWVVYTHSRTTPGTPGHSLGIPEASWKVLDTFREKSNFYEIFDFFGVTKKSFLHKIFFHQKPKKSRKNDQHHAKMSQAKKK